MVRAVLVVVLMLLLSRALAWVLQTRMEADWENYAAERASSYLEEASREFTDQQRQCVVDALDKRAVDEYINTVVEQAGHLDISFNLIGYGDVQKPLIEISVEDFMQPITNAMRSHFLTARAAARHMVKRGSGVILAFGGNGPQTLPGLGGFKVALDAIEGLRRQWACELGQHGIRVVTLKTGGVPESIPDTFAEKNEIAAGIQKATLLNRVATLADVGNVAAFVASDQARTLTSTVVNISCGALVD